MIKTSRFLCRSYPETRKQMEAVGYEVSGDGPEEYATFLKAETETWARVAKAANIPKE